MESEHTLIIFMKEKQQSLCLEQVSYNRFGLLRRFYVARVSNINVSARFVILFSLQKELKISNNNPFNIL